MTKRTATIEVTLGRDWRDDVRYLSELRPHRPSDSTLNLVEICDIVDLVVDGTNLTAAISEESVFGFIAQTMEGLWALTLGRNSKAIVEFHCEPWELCLTASGTDLLVSLYSVDRRQRVIAHDVRVDAASFVTSVARAAEELLADLFAISEAFATDPFVRRFSGVLGKIRRVHAVRFPHTAESVTGHLRTASTTSAHGVTMSYALEVGYAGLRDYQGEQAFDQHALLVPGSLGFEDISGVSVQCDGYPVLAVRAILDRVRELLTFLESSTTRFVCDSQLHQQLRLDVQSDGPHWRATVGTADSVQQLEFACAPNVLLDGLLSLAEMVVSDLASVNEHLQLNQRFLDLQEEVRELRSWHADFADSNHYHDHPEQFLVEHGDLRPVMADADEPSFPFALGDVRALYPRRDWEFQAEKINFIAVTSDGDQLFVPTHNELISLERRTGAHQWSAHAEVGTLTSYALAGNVVIAADDSRQLHLYDRATGECRVRGAAELGSLIVDAAAYDDGRILVVADFHGALVGLDQDGGLLWRFDANHGLLSGMKCAGPVVCVMSSPGFVHGVNPANGKLLWKVRLGGLADAGPYFHQGRIYTLSHDPRTRQLTIHAMFPFTGRTAWQLRFDGSLAGRPDFIGDHLMVPVERHGQVALVGIYVEATQPEASWRLDVLSAGVDHPTRVTAVELDGVQHALVRTDTGEITCFRVADGETRWRVEHTSPSDLLFRNLDLAVVRDAVLCVGERMQLRDVNTGDVLHEFGEVMVAPEYVSVDNDLRIILGERGADHSDPDRLVAWSTQHFLAVVPT